MTAIVLAYHAIEAGPPPLSIEPDVSRDHLATIEDAGLRGCAGRHCCAACSAAVAPI